jgi:hypothetical protein
VRYPPPPPPPVSTYKPNLTTAQFRAAEEILQGSSDDESLYAPIRKTYDSISIDGQDLLFGSPLTDDLRDLHPSPVHIFRLWQTYLDNVHPLTKLFHAPTLQQQLLEATADLKNVGRPMEALMFGIYSMSIVSMDDDDCQTTFGDEKHVLLQRFQAGARQGLVNAGYLKSSEVVTLQAFALYLVCHPRIWVEHQA